MSRVGLDILTGRPQQHFVSLARSQNHNSWSISFLWRTVTLGKSHRSLMGSCCCRGVLLQKLCLCSRVFPLGNSTFKDPSFKGSFIQEALYLSKGSRLVERMWLHYGDSSQTSVYQISGFSTCKTLVECPSTSILKTPQSVTNAKDFCRSGCSYDDFSSAVHHRNHGYALPSNQVHWKGRFWMLASQPV